MVAPRAADAIGVMMPEISVAAALKAVSAAVIALACSGAAVADAAVIHVASHGDDGAAGSQSAPLRSLQRAVAIVEPGDRVLVAPGTYEGFRMTRSGSADAPITIGNVPGAQRPTITPSGSLNSVVQLDGVHDVHLNGLEVAGNATRWGAGIRVRGGSSRVQLSDLDVHGNSSFGVLLEDVTDTTVSSSRLYKNETGLQVSRAGAGVRIVGNDVYDNDRLIVNDEQPGNDRGANAMVFFRTTGPLTVEGNRAWGNRGPSHDWGFDGGAFEVYAASGVTIRDNVVWNNQNVMETGTDGTLPCAHNSFTGNVAYGAGRTGPAKGLILRCASDMVVADNTLDDLDKFAIDVTAAAKSFGGSIEGLRVIRNIAVSQADKLLSISSALPPSVVVDQNLVFNRVGGYLGYVAGRGNTRSLETFVAWTGLQSGGVQGDPLFVDPASADYRRRAGATLAPTWGAGAKALELAAQGRERCPAGSCLPPTGSPQRGPAPTSEPEPPAPAPQPAAPAPPAAPASAPPAPQPAPSPEPGSATRAPASAPSGKPTAPAARGRSCRSARSAVKRSARRAATMRTRSKTSSRAACRRAPSARPRTGTRRCSRPSKRATSRRSGPGGASRRGGAGRPAPVRACR